jgi:ribosome maturation factor RimP
MTESAAGTNFSVAFEDAVGALSFEEGFESVEVVVATIGPGRTKALVVMLDREGGLDIETCERAAARINSALDAFPDVMYTLEVSSAGVDRPLVKLADYDRFAGRDAKVVTTVAIGNAKTHRGVLGGTRENLIVLRTGPKNDAELTIPFDAIKTANLEYDIRADLQRAKREKRG